MTDPSSSHIVLRKLMKDHQRTTVRDLIWAFNKISRAAGVNWKKNWVLFRSQSALRFHNKSTGQEIQFASFDKPNSLAGSNLEDEKFAFSILWFEEPFQIAENETNEVRKLNWQKFLTIISSVHRSEKPHENFIQKTILTTNDWSKDGDPLIDKFWSPIREDIEILEKFGKQLQFDPSYDGGKGLLTMTLSGGVNEFQTEDYLKLMRQIRKEDYEFYKAIWLGVASSFVGNAYGAGNLQKIGREIDFSKINRWAVGWDYSSSKDWTVVCLVGYSLENNLVQVVEAERYHRGKSKRPISEPEVIAALWKIIESWNSKFDLKNSDFKVSILGDSRDSIITSYLNKYWNESGNNIKAIFAQPAPALKIGNASNFVRLMAFRYLIGARKFVIAPHLDWLLGEYRAALLDSEGSVKDRGDDGRQAVEYALSRTLPNLMPSEMWQIISQRERERQVETRVW